MLQVIEIGILCAFLTLFINYIIGKPGSQFSPYEIFSFYTVFISKWKLKRIGLFDQYSQQYHENLGRAKTKHELFTLKMDFKKIYYDAAEPFFTWERAVGMCSVCTGVWVSVLSGLMLNFNISEMIEIIVISHITIRILNKIL